MQSHVLKEKFFAVVGIATLFLIMFACYSSYTTANQKVVVINPGHSMGYDSGATSAYKSEAQVNQELAGRVVRLLNERGYKVYITHTTDEELASQKLLTNEEGSALRNIGAAVNSVSPDLAMAIHHNSAGSTASGYELYWSSYRSFDQSGVYEVPNMWPSGSGSYRDSSPCAAATESQRFADLVKAHMEGIPNLSYRKTVERDDYLPAHATSPCILYEGGFLSNPTEAAYLASDQYQTEAANRIANAIDEFFGTVQAPDNELPVINSVNSSTTDTSDYTYTISCNATDNVGVQVVRFATWTEENGQDDLVWQDAHYDGDNNWSGEINVQDHNLEPGTYITHVYAYDRSGNFVGVAAPYVNVRKAEIPEGLSVEQLNSNTAVSYINIPESNKSYKFAVWSDNNGQDDIIWGDGTSLIGGGEKYVISRSEHNGDSGLYYIHVYDNDNNFVADATIDFGSIETDSITADLSNDVINMTINNLVPVSGANNVRFAVWSENNGQDDLIWYSAAAGDNGTYTAQANTSSHPGGGTIWIHAYLTDDNGLDQFIGSAGISTGTQSNASASNDGIKVEIGARAGNNVTVTVSNVPEGNSILVPTWSEVNGQDDLIWYEANRQGNTHAATINLANHTGTGVYNTHVYSKDAAGNLTGISAHTFEVAEVSSAGVTVDTPIMGNSGTTVAQLVTLYNEHSPISFPEYYVSRGVSLGDFAQMYIDEANNENVRADLAFCQAMLETGWLGFGGDVNISQFNFAGLGATGNGVPGENFSQKYGDDANGIRMGIRAQIQHLKAYGSTEPLSQECVDSRFEYVSRGRASTIGGLTGTWAVDTNYAPKIINFISMIK